MNNEIIKKVAANLKFHMIVLAADFSLQSQKAEVSLLSFVDIKRILL